MIAESYIRRYGAPYTRKVLGTSYTRILASNITTVNSTLKASSRLRVLLCVSSPRFMRQPYKYNDTRYISKSLNLRQRTAPRCANTSTKNERERTTHPTSRPSEATKGDHFRLLCLCICCFVFINTE